MRFPQKIERDNRDIIQAAVNSPFIKGLSQGKLPPKVFDYYIAQDMHQLYDTIRAVGICTSKAKDDDLPFFIGMQQFAYLLLEERTGYFASAEGFHFTKARTPAHMQLSAFTLQLALHGSVETAFAAIISPLWMSVLAGKGSSSWCSINQACGLDVAVDDYKDFLERCVEEQPTLYQEISDTLRISFLHMHHFWEDAFLMKDAANL